MTTKLSLSKKITEDVIQEAFEKTKSQFHLPGIDLVLITEQFYEKALKLYKDDFLPHEPLCKAVGLEWSDLKEEFMLQILKQHLSLMFLDAKTGEPVAFRIMNLIYRDDKDELEPPVPLNVQDLMQYMRCCNEQSHFFDHFGTDEAFRFVALVVTSQYQRRGLATKIFHAAIDMIRNFGFGEVFIKGEGTSNYSKKIYEKEGFETLYENIFDSWEVDGRYPFKNTGEHKSFKIYGRRLLCSYWQIKVESTYHVVNK